MSKVTVLGGVRLVAGKARSVEMISDKLTVDMTHNKAGRLIAASMKNEIAAGIRAIDVDADPITIERRKRGAGRSRDALAITDAFERQLQGQRKKRKSKFLGKGKWGNDTGRLSNLPKVLWALENPELEVYIVNAPAGRVDPSDPVWDPNGRNTGSYERFRANLFNYVPELRDGNVLWNKPRVQKAIKKALAKMFILKTEVKGFGSFGLSPRIR